MPSTLSQNEQGALTHEDRFRFACGDALPCFTQCCRDVNIYLTPYDVLRLRRALGGIGSAEFLARYTRHFLARRTNIPVVQFAMDGSTLYCRLVTEDGCSVYPDRPWACRMFPLDIAPGDGQFRMIAGKERCLGLAENTSRTVQEWLDSQGVAPYVEMERIYQSVMPECFQPGAPMNEGLGRVLFLAYDLDRFAAMLEDPRFQKLYEVGDDTLAAAREGGEALLLLAFRYIRAQMDELYQVL